MRYAHTWRYHLFGRICPHGKRRVYWPTRGKYVVEDWNGQRFGHWTDGPWANDFLDMDWRKRLRHKRKKRAGVRKKVRKERGK